LGGVARRRPAVRGGVGGKQCESVAAAVHQKKGEAGWDTAGMHAATSASGVTR
jgi:hypothetical protein